MPQYDVHAWCERPFIARFDVEAASPDEAMAKARNAVHDAPAEECDQGYYWNEFAVYDEHGKELLLVLDAEARLCNAAQMRETLDYVALMLADFKPDFLRQIGLDVALEKVEAVLRLVAGKQPHTVEGA